MQLSKTIVFTLVCLILSASLAAQFTQETFQNIDLITVPDNAQADIYPSSITVSGMPEYLSFIQIHLEELYNNQENADFDILLEAPDGQRITILSDVDNYSNNFSGYESLILDMDALIQLNAENFANSNDNYLPTNMGEEDNFPILGPISSIPSFLPLQNIDPNGEWKLYIVDDMFNESEAGLTSWGITIESSPDPICERPDDPLDVISILGNTVEVSWSNIAVQNWDIYYDTEEAVEIDYTTAPSIENLTGGNYKIINLEYDNTYYIYYRIDCGTDNADVSRWVGPVKVAIERNICANAEDISGCEKVFYDTDNTYVDAFFDPCTGSSLFVRQYMYNFRPDENGDHYLSSITDNNIEISSLSIRPILNGSTFCDSTEWRCVDLGTGQDYLIPELSRDTTYKILIFSNNQFEFSMGRCAYPRGIEIESIIPHPHDVDFVFFQMDNPMTGNFDFYISPSPSSLPDELTTPTLDNIMLTDGSVGTVGMILTENTDYELFLRSDCDGAHSCWVGPFDFTTDINCGDIDIDAIDVRTTGTTAWIQYPDEAYNGITVIYSKDAISQPLYDAPLDYEFVTNGSSQNPFTPGVFIYRLEANTSYTYFLKNNCNAVDYASQPWQGPYTFETNGESFIEPETMYCKQCYIVDTGSKTDARIPLNAGNKDLFPNLDPKICTFEEFDPRLEEVFIFDASETGTVELEHILFGTCGGGNLTEFLVQYYIKPTSEPFDFNDWEYLGCIYREGTSSPQNVTDEILLQVEQDSSYYILADIYGNICNASSPTLTRFFVDGNCDNPCELVSDLTATPSGDGFFDISWTDVEGSIGYEVQGSRGSSSNLSECSSQFVLLQEENNYNINGDSLIAIYPENTPVSVYVRVHCSDEHYSGWQEVSLTPEIGSRSEFVTSNSLGPCSPNYDRTTLSPLEETPYDLIAFSVSTTGKYFFETRVLSSPLGTYIGVYENSFSPDNPGDNLLFETESNNAQRIEFSLELTPGVDYIFLASSIDIPTFNRTINLVVDGPDFFSSDGFVFEGIQEGPEGNVPVLDGTFYMSNKMCVDEQGWRHYYYADESNPGGEDLLLLSVENYDEIDGYQGFNNASIGGSAGSTLITNPPADYVTIPEGWHSMNRYWDFNIPNSVQPESPATIRFYYTIEDLNALATATGMSDLMHEDLNFNKINDPNNSYDIDPENGHVGIPTADHCAAAGIWEYSNGSEADTTTWKLGSYANVFYAELDIHSFSGGGGGVGSFQLITDNDNDGFDSSVDCDDNDPNVNPDVEEIPYDGIDNDCNAATLDDDLDEDGFPLSEDCDDLDVNINPDVEEVPYDGIDNDCNIVTLDDDLDQDGFPLAEDCDDEDSGINPDAAEIVNNGIDEDCDGVDLLSSVKELDGASFNIFPNPVNDHIIIDIKDKKAGIYAYRLIDITGKFAGSQQLQEDRIIINVANNQPGIYLLEIISLDSGNRIVEKIHIIR